MTFPCLRALNLEQSRFDVSFFTFRASRRRSDFASVFEDKVTVPALSGRYDQFFLWSN